MLSTPLPLNTFDSQFVVYEIFMPEPRFTVWVGFCSLVEFPRLADARRNAVMRDYLANAEFIASACVQVLKTGTDQTSLFNREYGDFTVLMNPSVRRTERDGLAEKRTGRNKRAVLCVETGEEFESASEAAKHHDLNSGQLSVHLNHGRGTVKGRTYRYVDRA